MRPQVAVIGGGLAGPEAAWQLARRGCVVELWEMRPHLSTPAHQTGALGELVCSNSLKSEAPDSAPWLLKQELRRGGSLLLECAAEAAVPGGQALTVDRDRFSAEIESRLQAHPGIRIRRQEARELPPDQITVLASGPLTSGPLAAALAAAAGRQHLYFYDAISPIVDAATVNRERVYAAGRYGKGGDDYWNCPLNQPEYERFRQAVLDADSYPLHAFEEPRYFEACLPLEELARRGPETLRFGPMKPVGLPDPRTGKIPHAVVQLRRENLRSDSFNLVGFQNHIRHGAQPGVLRLIPGLEQARFLRLGQVHRNTYVAAPAVLNERLQLRARQQIFLAGQLCGTEGYVEAIATGWLAGQFAAAAAQHRTLTPPPRETALGALLHYIAHSDPASYTPANISFDLLPPPVAAVRQRAERRRQQCERALAAWDAWWRAAGEEAA
ncbi:MAG TPA: methylenetetrahydrofolate--tRNA-(uracil(54)-C(5))-methyltransferase (FADH(2)-oxidizing) TrmFO [Terriglobales bacterium]|nr:methylenetetrahydrofolate--tRNA-(uracil(54)-C(5))-methyltransferase (FADH(2)-oxidizing) TrmFO [Terriglobales bacterium]